LRNMVINLTDTLKNFAISTSPTKIVYWNVTIISSLHLASIHLNSTLYALSKDINETFTWINISIKPKVIIITSRHAKSMIIAFAVIPGKVLNVSQIYLNGYIKPIKYIAKYIYVKTPRVVINKTIIIALFRKSDVLKTLTTGNVTMYLTILANNNRYIGKDTIKVIRYFKKCPMCG